MSGLMGNNVLADPNKTFFYPSSMLSSNRRYADLKHDDAAYLFNVLYNTMIVQSDRAGLQADSITKDNVLAGLISEQIMGFCIPSIINNYEEGNGGMRIC